MMRNLLWSLLLVFMLVVAAVFAALNTGRIELDLAFFAIEVDTSIALLGTFAAGWVFGLACVALVALRLLAERRRLRRAARIAEEELRALRSLPVKDAD